MSQEKQIPLIEVSGGDFECGEAIGKALQQQVHENIESYMEVFVKEAGVTLEVVRKHAKRLIPAIQGYAPDLLMEMRGIGAGATATIEDIVALNARTEIMFGLKAKHKVRSGAEDGDECTSIGVLPSITADGHTIIGQNWDWRQIVADRTALLKIRKPNAPTILVFTEAGIVGKIGMNETGIGVLSNLLVSTHDQGQQGIPVHVILRKILNARSLHEAIKSITATDRGTSGNFLVGARGGEVIDIEATPKDFTSILPEDDNILTHSNHFLSPEFRPIDIRKGVSAMTLIRHVRARRLLARDSGTINVKSFMRVFRDHFSYPHGICRHVDDSDSVLDRTLTGASMIMDLDANTMDIAKGPPCMYEYVKQNAASSAS